MGGWERQRARRQPVADDRAVARHERLGAEPAAGGGVRPGEQAAADEARADVRHHHERIAVTEGRRRHAGETTAAGAGERYPIPASSIISLPPLRA